GPTTGMNARAKRFLWNCILTLTHKDHKSVSITSHSMKECEILSENSNVSAAFGHGYSILVRADINSDTKNVIKYIKQRILEDDAKEDHNKMINFRVSTTVSLYKMFSVLEKAHEELGNIIGDGLFNYRAAVLYSYAATECFYDYLKFSSAI
ncbi:unnamed protein product, partial [Rotaria sp. Silwood1]